MQLKVFHIRFSEEHSLEDQDAINNFMTNVAVKKTSVELVSGQEPFWSIIVFYDNKGLENERIPANKISVLEESELTTVERQIYETLRRWRQDKANQLNVPSYVISHNTELMTLAKLRPKTLDELSRVKGFGGQKISKHGEELLMLLNSIG